MTASPNCQENSASLVAPLDCFSQDDLQQAGGKAANLGEMIRAGFPVPPGFVITSAAYDRFVDQNRLREQIAQALSVEDSGGHVIRRAFEDAPIPAGVEQDILAAYQQLGKQPVAVRSSATAEDLPEAAFAGQQDTYLNIAGDSSLLDAVRRCWASLWTDRSIAYRKRLGIEQQTVKLAVVVQRMVPAEMAGVLFTANPVTGARDEIVIDASPGLGEAVVSGLVTPEHIVLDKGSGRVKQRKPGRREVIIQALPGGGTQHIEGAADGGSSTVPPGALVRMAQAGAALERHFGRPQDVEWAWKSGELFLLQSRPVTALPDPPPRPDRFVKMLSALFAEMFPVRPYPLDNTTWIPALSKGAVEPIFSLLGLSVPSIDRMFVQENGIVIRFAGEVQVRLTPAVLLAPLRIIANALRYDPNQWMSDPQPLAAMERARFLEAVPIQDLTYEELLIIVREALALPLHMAGEPRARYFPRAVLAAGMLRAVLGLLGLGECFGILISGGKSSTVAANQALEVLAVQVRTNSVLGRAFAKDDAGNLLTALQSLPEARAFLEDLKAFMDRYGHRETVLSTVQKPTWKDDPEVVLAMIKGFALSEPRSAGEQPAWETVRQQLLAHPLLRLSPIRAAVLALLRTARCFLLIREDTHFNATRILPILRRTLLEIGRRLCAVDAIDSSEEVFHLQYAELEQIGGNWPPAPGLIQKLRATVKQRKERRASLEGIPVVDPRLYWQEGTGSEALLQGTPGSPGIAQGPVRVIRDASQFGELRAGEILVAPFTNPSWTPLFQRAAAVIVDGGAAGSHAAIVAREYGIPAVMGTVAGTQQLHNGDWVLVDGSRGIVQTAQPPK
jgi:pyruvate,water dikinase